jgi:beta-phosphoglucomutase
MHPLQACIYHNYDFASGYESVILYSHSPIRTYLRLLKNDTTMKGNSSAFIFDLNGTMIDDMNFHLKVWTEILNKDLGAGLTEAEVKENMYGKNHELLERVFGKSRFTFSEADKISKDKEDRYQALYRPHMKLIKGLPAFLQRAYKQNLPMAIGSAAIPYNIDFVLDTLDIKHYFKSIVSANDVDLSKPHPETFLKAAKQLNVQSENCVVFEDAPKGVEAAFNAGMRCVVITTLHKEDEFKRFSNIQFFIKDYSDPRLEDLLR